MVSRQVRIRSLISIAVASIALQSAQLRAQTANITSCADFARVALSSENDVARLVRVAQAPNMKTVSLGSGVGKDLLKDEFETTEQFGQRRLREWKKVLGRDLMVVRVPLKTTAVRYDADTGKASVQLAATDLLSAAGNRPASAIDLDFKILREKAAGRGALTQAVGIHFDPGHLAGNSGDYGGNEVRLPLDVPRARLLKTSGTLALLVSVTPVDTTEPLLRVAATPFAARFKGDPSASTALQYSFRVTPVCAAVFAGSKFVADARPLTLATLRPLQMQLPPLLTGATLSPRGFGPLLIGSSLDSVRRSVGIPMKNLGDPLEEEPDASCDYWGPADLKMPFLGLLAEDGRLASITLTDEYVEDPNEQRRWTNIKTDRGIGLGDSVAQVRAAYPEAVREEGYDEGPLDLELYHWDKSSGHGVKFEIDDGVVSTISVGTKAIRYYEGCA